MIRMKRKPTPWERLIRKAKNERRRARKPFVWDRDDETDGLSLKATGCSARIGQQFVEGRTTRDYSVRVQVGRGRQWESWVKTESGAKTVAIAMLRKLGAEL